MGVKTNILNELTTFTKGDVLFEIRVLRNTQVTTFFTLGAFQEEKNKGYIFFIGKKYFEDGMAGEIVHIKIHNHIHSQNININHYIESFLCRGILIKCGIQEMDRGLIHIINTRNVFRDLNVKVDSIGELYVYKIELSTVVKKREEMLLSNVS